MRAIADGEIVAYRLATKPAKATRSPEAGKPGDGIDLYTSPSFCLVRHRYEAGEQNKNRLTFYSLYMHIACENTYSSPEAARVTVKGTGVSTYEPVAQGDPLKLTRRLSGSSPLYAKKGAEVKLLLQTPSNLLNHNDEAHDYFLVHYVDEPNNPFYIAESQLQQEYPQKPKWMIPPEGKPARHGIPSNTWLRQSANTTAGSLGLPAGSEVVVSSESQMVNINGGPTEFRKVQVFKVGSGAVKDSANQVMTSASKGSVGWLAKSKVGAGLAAEPSIPVEFKEGASVVDRSENPIAVQAGEVIGHWGEHELATASASGFEKDADSKAVHVEVFVAESDKQALEDCINNKARVTGGQGYLLVKKEVTTYRLTSDSQHGFHHVAAYGPLVLPLAVKESDIVTHGANNFVKVRERSAADGELAGEFVLLAGDVEVVSQHDWHKLGVKLVDGSSDDDGFLDKADTESEEPQQKEASAFFSTLYDKLVTDRDNDGTLSGNDIKAALADEELAGKLRMLFIKHKSEWVQPGEWPRLKQELAEQPKLYEYAMQVHRNMAWVEDASAILGDTKPWFIHPAGMMGLVGDIKQSKPIIFPLKVKPENDQGNKWDERYWAADERNNAATFNYPRNNGRKHAARELYTSPFEEVIAVSDGEVLQVVNFYCETHEVTILHRTCDGRSFIMRYGELAPDRIKVSVGDTVIQGQSLGYTGKLLEGGFPLVKIDGEVVFMLHVEVYSGQSGHNLNRPLTNRSARPYQRREDLVDAINILKEGYYNSFGGDERKNTTRRPAAGACK